MHHRNIFDTYEHWITKIYYIEAFAELILFLSGYQGKETGTGTAVLENEPQRQCHAG